jgi:integrase
MTGVRPGELCALRWSDLDGSTLRVQRALSYTADGWVVCDTKTSGSRRAIILGDLEQRALARQRKRQAVQRLQAGAVWQDDDLVFATASGRPHDARNISRRVLPRLLERAKLPRMRLYDLRHSSATLLLAAGINPKVVSERLGHSTTRLTLDTYSHVLPSMQQEAAEVLGRLVGGRMAIR